MKLGLIVPIVNAVKSLVPTARAFLFSDGKFRADRALLLLFFFAAICVAVYFLGPQQVADAVDILDDVSDILGVVTE